MITSAEEAIDLQKRNSALNRFYWNFSQPDKDKTSHVANYGKLMKRDVGERVVKLTLSGFLFPMSRV